MSEPPPWQLTLEAVAHFPRPCADSPSALAFSPDGRLLTYLFSERGDLTRQLWAADAETGDRWILARPPEAAGPDEALSPEEALRRERQRVREGGITQYAWAKRADRILIPFHGRLFLTSSAGGVPRPIELGPESISDARLTPDGQRVVFVRAGDLWVADVASGSTLRLTDDAREGVFNGLAEYIAQEEMGRAEGFWISPDGALVAYTQVDETRVPAYPIVHLGPDAWRVEHHRYPFAGGENARVRLGIVGLVGGPTRWLDLGPDPDIYLARVDWRPDGCLCVQTETRDQRRLQLWCYDASTGARTLLVEEESQVWVNLHRDLRFVGSSGSFVWSSEANGFRHLSLHGPDGTLIRALTHGEWAVDGVVHVDEGAGWLYFLAGRETPVERHLYRVSIEGGDVERLTTEAGYHSAVFAEAGDRYAHSFEAGTEPPAVVIRSTRGGPPVLVHDPGGYALTPPLSQRERGLGDAVSPALSQGEGVSSDRLSPWERPASPRERAQSGEGVSPSDGEALRRCVPGLSPPEIVGLASRDGVALYGAVYRPPASEGGAPCPVIVSVYGGPHVQMVANTWGLTVDLRAQYLASRGFLVFKLDNRGSARRGVAFEGAIQRRLGTVEVEDQVDGVRWLIERGLADPERVGVYGWSYGGYLSLMCLLTAPDVFRVAVAGAPVVDWDGYDTHYTERYMDTPARNPAGYAASSALTHAAALRGKLLLVHGLVDENVHFRHTARFVAALTQAGRPYDLAVFPTERHMPRDEAGRRYLEQRVVDYFVEHLGQA